MPLTISILLFAGVTFALSIASVYCIRTFLGKQLLDVPNERSSHTAPTPRGGGLGFIIAVAIALFVTWIMEPRLLTGISSPLWLLLIPLITVGIIDDWRDLSPSVRYFVHLSVATGIVLRCGSFPVPGLESFGTPGHVAAMGLTIFGLTAFINFYNFMDGLDGLVAGVSASQLSFLALTYHQPVLWLWVAALLGFLYWNWSPAKIFMGDAGSTTLGAVVGIALLSSPETTVGVSWIMLAILLPLVGDTVYTLCRRFIQGKNIFKSHRGHLYQRLHQAGLPHSRVAGLYIALTLLIILGIAQWGAAAAWLTLGMTPGAIALAEFHIARSTTVATTA